MSFGTRNTPIEDGLRVRLLGGFEVEGLTDREVGSRKARTLLKVLAVARGAPVTTEVLADCLWGDDQPARPADQVGVLVSRLRGVLGADRLPRTGSGYALRADWTDVIAMEELAEDAAVRLAAGGAAAARLSATAALELARGPLIVDEDGEWADVPRASADRTIARVRLIAAEAALSAGDPGRALELAETALDRDPYDEAALRLVMVAHERIGRPASALARYAEVRARLADDLGVNPTAATEELHSRLLLVDDDKPPAAAPAVAPELPGRDGELAALDRAFAEAGAGAVVLAAVEGEAGIGKTALLEAWSSAVRQSGGVALTGRCDALGRDLPLQPIADALDAHLRLLDPAEVAAILGDDEPVLATILGWRSGASGEVAPENGLAVLFEALLDAVARCGAGGPTVLVLDDVHHAGRSTIEWLLHATRRRRGRAVLIVVARRGEEGTTPLGATTTIVLGPLDLVAAEAVVGGERAAELFARSGGHPLFLTELAAVGAGELPASIREAVAERCERAGPAAATLRAAAVLGPTIDVDLLAEVLRCPAVELIDDIEEGLRRRLLEERPEGVTFRHELVRDALAAGSSAARKALIHRDAAITLNRRPERDPLAVALHARLGGDRPLAAASLAEAAEVAGVRGDHNEAERLLTDAIDLADGTAMRLARARARIARLHYGAASEDALVALDLGAGAAAQELLGWASYFLRDFATSAIHARAAAATGEGDVRSRSFGLLARIDHADGRVREAARSLAEAEVSATAGSSGELAVWHSILLAHEGKAAEAVALAELAGRARLSGQQPFVRLHRFQAAAHAYGELGDVERALVTLDAFDAELDRSPESGDRFRPRAINYRSWVLFSLGATEEADAASVRGWDMATGFGLDEPAAHASLDLADHALLAGDPANALTLVERAEGLQDAPTNVLVWHQQQRSDLLRARIALATDQPELALEAASQLAVAAADLGTMRYELLARAAAGVAAVACDDPLPVEQLDEVVQRLPSCAGLEAWWVTAELANAYQVDRWWTLADERIARLANAAGDHRETFTAHANKRMTAFSRK